jgi:vacuolar-type H+-ATPase subunit H
MIKWVNLRVKDLGVEVSNLKSAWTDGKAFCALVYILQPSAIDFHSIDFSPENAQQNLKLAFDAAESIGIPPLLDVTDVINNPDDKSIYTYLINFHKKYSELGTSPRPNTNSGTSPRPNTNTGTSPRPGGILRTSSTTQSGSKTLHPPKETASAALRRSNTENLTTRAPPVKTTSPRVDTEQPSYQADKPVSDNVEAETITAQISTTKVGDEVVEKVSLLVSAVDVKLDTVAEKNEDENVVQTVEVNLNDGETVQVVVPEIKVDNRVRVELPPVQIDLSNQSVPVEIPLENIQIDIPQINLQEKNTSSLDKELEEKIKELQIRLKEVEQIKQSALIEAENIKNSARLEVEKAKKDASLLLRKAETDSQEYKSKAIHEAKQLTDRAHRDAHTITFRAQEEAEKIKLEARKKAQGQPTNPQTPVKSVQVHRTGNETQNDSKKIIDNAKIEAEKIMLHAKKQQEEIERAQKEAELRAKATIDTAQSEAQEIHNKAELLKQQLDIYKQLVQTGQTGTSPVLYFSICAIGLTIGTLFVLIQKRLT